MDAKEMVTSQMLGEVPWPPQRADLGILLYGAKAQHPNSSWDMI